MSLTEKQIEEGSKLIANFMDYIYVGKRILTHNRRGHNQTPSITGYIHKSQINDALDFDFYKSMNIAGVGRLAHNYSLSNTVELGLKNGWYFSAICNHGTGLKYLPLNLKYHSSWDWLMPVIEKIEKLPITDKGVICISIDGNCCDIFLNDWGGHDTISMGISKNGKLDATYKAVVDFIKWYNLNLKNN